MRHGPCVNWAGSSSRLFVRPLFALALALATNGLLADDGDSDLSVVDHLVYAAPDLDAGIAEIERLTGIRATIGGSQGLVSMSATGKYIPCYYPSASQLVSASTIFSAWALLEMLNLDLGTNWPFSF